MDSSLSEFERQVYWSAGELSLRWTRHAIERVAQRFRFTPKIRIPETEITIYAATLQAGTKFRFVCCGVVYQCCRGKRHVTIISVWPARGVTNTDWKTIKPPSP